MREQGIIVQTGRLKRQLVKLIFVMALLVAVLFLVLSAKLSSSHPSFESNAKSGTPEVEEGFMYEEVESDFGYSFDLAANVYQQENGSCYVYFTNPEDNDVYLQYEMVETDSDTILYKSGVIKPGQYVEKLSAYSKFANEKKDVTVKIYAFDSEDWTSEGTTTVELTLQAW